jgi:hypothetical protein
VCPPARRYHRPERTGPGGTEREAGKGHRSGIAGSGPPGPHRHRQDPDCRPGLVQRQYHRPHRPGDRCRRPGHERRGGRRSLGGDSVADAKGQHGQGHPDAGRHRQRLGSPTVTLGVLDRRGRMTERPRGVLEREGDAGERQPDGLPCVRLEGVRNRASPLPLALGQVVHGRTQPGDQRPHLFRALVELPCGTPQLLRIAVVRGRHVDRVDRHAGGSGRAVSRHRGPPRRSRTGSSARSSPPPAAAHITWRARRSPPATSRRWVQLSSMTPVARSQNRTTSCVAVASPVAPTASSQARWTARSMSARVPTAAANRPLAAVMASYRALTSTVGLPGVHRSRRRGGPRRATAPRAGQATT